MSNINTLSDFYKLMFTTRDLRLNTVDEYLNNTGDFKEQTNELKKSLETLKSVPHDEDKYFLDIDKNKKIQLDIGYEINELKKDIFFLEEGEDKFLSYLGKIHSDFEKHMQMLVDKLNGIKFKNFISDRDGTVNNYCGRYASSVQSVYNAVFLSRFAKNIPENSIILTSAPLDNIGLADISVTPKNIFIYAGSKGREYFNKKGERCQLPIEKDKRLKLDEINKVLSNLTKTSQYNKYSLIGSGLQFKFGQTTIARQDITKSINEEESLDFLEIIKKEVRKIDPENKFFRIEDTGKDIEIILTVSGDKDTGLKDFDKGNGINFMDEDLGLNIKDGPCLICGDTDSDVPMVKTAMDKTNLTTAVFVTENTELKDKVRSICPNSYFVPTPDILVAALNSLGRGF